MNWVTCDQCEQRGTPECCSLTHLQVAPWILENRTFIPTKVQSGGGVTRPDDD